MTKHRAALCDMFRRRETAKKLGQSLANELRDVKCGIIRKHIAPGKLREAGIEPDWDATANFMDGVIYG